MYVIISKSNKQEGYKVVVFKMKIPILIFNIV